jgi:hypothetical protein
MSDMSDKKASCFADLLKQYIGQQVAVLCARYQYRGVLSECLSDSLVLANAASVEISGPSNQTAPNTEDKIHSSVVIKYDAVEIFYQPKWAFAPLD